MAKSKGTIGILTGGGDVPGLNPAIRAVTLRAISEGYRVLGIRHGWRGLVDIVPQKEFDNSSCVVDLSAELVEKIGRTGGTFLHTSRTRPTHLPKSAVPEHLRGKYKKEVNDITPEIIKNLEFLGIDYLIPIGGDDTLSFGQHLHHQGVKVVAIPKTMDNDVPGTDYCIGFSTCVTRTIELTQRLRTCAGSHERFMVIEVFGRYAGFTALFPTLAGAADRCVIPEHPFDVELLADLMSYDRRNDLSHYSIVLVSEGAKLKGEGSMHFEGKEKDQYGHQKLGGIGDIVSEKLMALSPKFNKGKKVNVLNQRLGYLVRCGDPDAMDSIVPMVYGTLAIEQVLAKQSGVLVALRNGRYDVVPIDVVTGRKKVVDVEKYYRPDRLRPKYKTFFRQPLFIMTSEI